MSQEQTQDLETMHIASDLVEGEVHSEVAEKGIRISIWFFIGLILVVYGVLITAYSIYQWQVPPPAEERVYLFEYHAGIWWGILMFVWGGIYLYYFSPKNNKR